MHFQNDECGGHVIEESIATHCETAQDSPPQDSKPLGETAHPRKKLQFLGYRAVPEQPRAIHVLQGPGDPPFENMKLKIQPCKLGFRTTP